MERIVAAYADGFGDMSHDQPTFSGNEAKAVMRARLKRLFEDYRAELVPIVVDIAFFGEQAFAYGWHHMTLHPRQTGERVPSFARASLSCGARTNQDSGE